MAKRKNASMAALAYIIFFLPGIMVDRKDEFVRFHMRQGAWLLVVALALQGLLSLWVFWGMPLGGMLRGLIRVFLIIQVAIGGMTALRSEQKELPLIGKYAPKFF
ncbi:MAG: hypothetical protein R3251_02345 [Candidatus Spechtbacterales bacterium]|nr:hypothetical protein [Candidatus Spechtbacterales bacterium]